MQYPVFLNSIKPIYSHRMLFALYLFYFFVLLFFLEREQERVQVGEGGAKRWKERES